MSSDLANGAIFAGRYRIERRIASGGMGAVYEVVHLETNRRRALKVMHENFVQSEELRGRFRQEARVAAQIESEYIVDVFDAGIDEATGMPFLVMELLRGEELGKRLRQKGSFSPSEVVSYLHQTALALDKTHRASIVHRDLKPDNLFLCERDDGPPRIKVLDFGIAKMVAEGATQAAATRSLGTPLYMAPEQFLLDAGVSAATDIFALGMIAFTLLVGKPYWLEESNSGASVFAFAANAALGPREPATARAARLGATLPPQFDAWFARITAKNPADRFPTASAAVKGLAEALRVPVPGVLSSGVLGPASIPHPVFAPGPASTPTPASRTPFPSVPEMQPPSPSYPNAAAMGASATPMGPMLTPINSGMTAAPASKPRVSKMVIGVGVTFVVGVAAIVLFFVFSGPTEKAGAATPASSTTQAAAAQATTAPAPEVKPVAVEPPPVDTASAAPAAPASSIAKNEPPKPAVTTKTSKSPGTPPVVTTKKPMWQND